MGWEVTVAGEKHQFDTKQDAENWIARSSTMWRATSPLSLLSHIARSIAVREVDEEINDSAPSYKPSGEWQLSGDDVVGSYIERLESYLAENGYRLVDWEPGEVNDANVFTDPLSGEIRDTDQYTIRYRVEPLEGDGPLQLLPLSFGDSPTGASTQMWGDARGSVPVELTETVVHDRTTNMLADYETYQSRLDVLDEEAVASGLSAEEQIRQMEYRRAAYEAEMNTKAMLLVKASQAAVDKTWSTASKWAGPTQAARALTGSGYLGDQSGSGYYGLGEAAARLYDEGRDYRADILLESEFTTVSAGHFENVNPFGVPETSGELAPGGPTETGISFEDALASIGGGGGGFSYPEPVYEPPDRREVEDQVRGILAALVGVANNDRLQRLTDKYMAAHKRAWENPQIGLEPRMDVYEDIRNSKDYQNIHKLRPDTVEEADWVSQRVFLGERYGLSATAAQTFGINQAIAGTSQGNIEDAASMFQTQRSGRLQGSILDRVRENTTSMFRNVR